MSEVGGSSHSHSCWGTVTADGCDGEIIVVLRSNGCCLKVRTTAFSVPTRLGEMENDSTDCPSGCQSVDICFLMCRLRGEVE
jgi:hypothetical protein